MTSAQALDRITDGVCASSMVCDLNHRKTRVVASETVELLPSREVAVRDGCEATIQRIKKEVRASLRAKGIIRVSAIVGVILIFPILWEVIIGVVVALLVRWLVNDLSQAMWIQQARGNA